MYNPYTDFSDDIHPGSYPKSTFMEMLDECIGTYQLPKEMNAAADGKNLAQARLSTTNPIPKTTIPGNNEKTPG